MVLTPLSPHGWNHDFVWEDHTGPFTTLAEAQVAQFDDKGYVVIPDILDQETLATCVEEIDRLEAGTEAFLRDLDDERFYIAEAGAITFSTFIVNTSPFVRGLAASPIFAGICRDLVGPDVRLYHDQAVYKKPEKPRRFPWHQDNGYTFVEPQAYLTCWVALTDATLDNGCPQVAPGLHRQGTLRHRYIEPLGWECFPDYPDREVAEVNAGGAVIFSSLTPHLTGPNTTDAVRKAYILQYAPEGARRCEGSPAVGPPTNTAACTDADRQFPILIGGERQSPPPPPSRS